tara:strand:+ start:69277 stop:69411 length:135 start_codon:yes stop_codon:yes gene_type:complete
MFQAHADVRMQDVRMQDVRMQDVRMQDVRMQSDYLLAVLEYQWA